MSDELSCLHGRYGCCICLGNKFCVDKQRVLEGWEIQEKMSKLLCELADEIDGLQRKLGTSSHRYMDVMASIREFTAEKCGFCGREYK